MKSAAALRRLEELKLINRESGGGRQTNKAPCSPFCRPKQVTLQAVPEMMPALPGESILNVRTLLLMEAPLLLQTSVVWHKPVHRRL